MAAETTMITMRMMIERIKKCSLILFLLFLTSTSYSQENQFGIWYGVSLTKGITKRLSADVSGMLRTYENAGKVEQGFIEAGLEYKITDYLSAAASYRLTDKYEEDIPRYCFQHKIFIDLKGNFKISRFGFNARFRFQGREKTYDNENDFRDYTVRLKLKGTYKTQSFPVNPYIYAETFMPVFEAADKTMEKTRFALGGEYKLTKKQSVELEYIFEHDYLPVKSAHDNHIISLGYNLKF